MATQAGRRRPAHLRSSVADSVGGDEYSVLVPDRVYVEGRGGQLAGEAVLPELSSDEAVALLPDDPNELLTSDERRQLVSDLLKLATLRRDAEIASGSLRLA